MVRSQGRGALPVVLVLFLGLCTACHAQRVTLDGSLGRPGGVLQGPQYVIPEERGHIRGANLFHSFGQFSLSAGESATFTGASSIHNIIGRVTGGSPSVFNGLLRSQISGANLFLLNPSGVVFGPNAQVDVSGALHVSTADYLRLADGAVFAARLNLPSILSVAAPEAFGFLGPTPAPITVLGSTLHMPEGATLSLIGGDITVQPLLSPAPQLKVPGGRLHLASVASAGEVVLSPSDPSQRFQVETFSKLGTIQLDGGSVLDVSGARGGTVVIRGGRLVIDQAAIMSETHGDQDGARTGIDLATTQDILVTNGAFVVTSALGAGRGGDMAIQTGSLDVRNGAGLTTRAFPQSTGDGGTMTIMAESVQVSEGALLSTAVGGSSRGGDLLIKTGAFTLSGGAGLSSLALGPGPGGDIGVAAAETLTVAGRDSTGLFPSSVTTSVQGQGSGGRITLTAPTVQVNDSFVATATQSAGEGGAVSIQAGTLTLIGGAKIRSDVGGSGRGGTVTITGAQSLAMAGHDSNGIPSGISLTTFGTGAAGRVILAAPHISATDGAVIGTSALGAGRGGDIVVQAGTLELSRGVQVGSLTFGDAAGGALVLEAGILTLQDGGHLTSTSTGAGAGGDITLRATETVTMAGHDSAGVPGTILSVASGTGEAGRIALTAPTITVDSGIIGNIPLLGLAMLPPTQGRTGTITVQAGRVTLTNGGAIYSSNTTDFPGGSILVEATETLRIVGVGADQHPSGITTLTFGAGDAGHIAVSAPVLTLQGGQLSSGANRVGRTGSISVQTGTMLLTDRAGIFIETLGDTGTRTATMTITADVLEMRHAQIASNTYGPDHGGTVHITATMLTMADSLIQSQAVMGSTGDAGDIVLTLGQGTLTERSIIESSTRGLGAGGTINLTASTLEMHDTRIFSNTEGPRRAGTVSLVTSTLAIEGGGIQAATIGPGSGGDIVIAGSQLSFTGGAVASVNTQGDGLGGRIAVMATDTLTIAGRDARGLLSGFRSETMGRQDGGDIHITATALHMDGGRIAASTRSDGQAGEIAVKVQRLALTAGSSLSSASGVTDATGVLRVGTGSAGKVTISANDTMVLTEGSVIDTATAGGHGGRILVATPRLRLEGGSVINTGTIGPEDAGDIQVQASSVDMRGAFISTSTRHNGRAGNIGIHTGSLTLSEGAGLFSASGSVDVTGQLITVPGAAGIITVQATGDVALAGKSIISTQTAGGGDGGQIALTTPKLGLNDASVTARTFGMRPAGNIGITVGQVALTNGAFIDSTTEGAGPGGHVTVDATQAVSLGNASGIAAETRGAGAGGQITLSAPRLTLFDRAVITVNTQGTGRAGDIGITVGQATLIDGARIDSSTVGQGQGGAVTVTASEVLSLAGRALIGSTTAGFGVQSGAAGRVAVTAGVLRMTDGSLITAGTVGDGNAGNVTVQGTRLAVTGGAGISSTSGIAAPEGLTSVGTGQGGGVTVTATETITIAGVDSAGIEHSGIFSETGGPGAAGQVMVTAPRVQLAEQGRISTSTGGDGRAGDIVLQVGHLDLESGAQLSSASGILVGDQRFVGAGAGGTVQVTAMETVRITGPNSGLSTTTLGSGQGGDILVQAAQVQLTDGATITAQGRGAGDAGRVALTASGVVQSAHSAITTTATTGAGGVMQVTASTAIALVETELSATVTEGSRPGGNVSLTTPVLMLTGGRLAAETQGAGNAGNITLNVERLTVQGATLTSSSTATATGDAGSITLQGLAGPGTRPSQGLLAQSTLHTTAAHTGAGGAITLTTGGGLTLDHTTVSATVQDGRDRAGGPRGDVTITTPQLTLRDSRVTAETTGGRSAGDITLNVGSLLAQNATVSSSSTGVAFGNAGTVTLQGPGGPGTLATRLTLTGSVVATEATVADGGNIAILAQDTLRLRDSQLTTAVRSGVGRGGNILIDPDFVILERSQIRADAFGGPGGNIRLVAKAFLTDADSRVSASSAQSVQGTVAIEAFTTPTGLVAPLPSAFTPLATLLSTRCAARLREGRVGSFLVSGRDGLPVDPEGGLPSLPIAGGLEAETSHPHAHGALGRLAPPVPGDRSWPLRLWGGPDADCGSGVRW